MCPRGVDTANMDQSSDGGDVALRAMAASQLDLLLFHNLLDSSPDILYFKDRQSRYLRLSRGAQDALRGEHPDAKLGTSDVDHYDAAHAARARAQEEEIVRTGVPLVHFVEHQSWPDRPDTWVSSTKAPLLDADGEIVGTFGISRDVTARILLDQEAQRTAALLEHTHRALQRAEAELRTIIEHSPDAITRYDAALRCTYLNPPAQALAEGVPGRAIGRTTRERGHSEGMLSEWEPALGRVLQSGEPGEVDFAMVVGGQDRWFHARLVPEFDHMGAVVGVLATSRDLTQLKVAERLLAHQASHDPLTGLANRALMLDRLNQALLRQRRGHGLLVVLYLDLDGFKGVNDRYGHEAGDLVLIETARRLTDTARAADTVARLGGDEFVLVCEDVPDRQAANLLIERLHGVLSHPFTAAAPGARVSVSIGMTATDDAHTTPEQLLREADSAMYAAKPDPPDRAG